MRFSAKITSSCIWVAIPVDWVILHWYACGADGRTVDRSVWVTWLPNFLVWEDLLTHGAPLASSATTITTASYYYYYYYYYYCFVHTNFIKGEEKSRNDWYNCYGENLKQNSTFWLTWFNYFVNIILFLTSRLLEVLSNFSVFGVALFSYI